MTGGMSELATAAERPAGSDVSRLHGRATRWMRVVVLTLILPVLGVAVLGVNGLAEDTSPRADLSSRPDRARALARTGVRKNWPAPWRRSAGVVGLGESPTDRASVL